jgi:hypothetical protein
MEIESYGWQDLERMAQNRTRWRTVVSGLCTSKVQQACANKHHFSLLKMTINRVNPQKKRRHKKRDKIGEII